METGEVMSRRHPRTGQLCRHLAANVRTRWYPTGISLVDNNVAHAIRISLDDDPSFRLVEDNKRCSASEGQLASY